MKKLIILIFSVIVAKSYTQELKLSVDYEEPRIGQTIVIQLDPTFFNSYVLKNIPEGFVEKKGYTVDKTFKYQLEAKQTGEYYIGPFEFEFNDKIITTDSIRINIIDALPLKEGLWIRNYNHGKEHLVIIEEYSKEQADFEFEDYHFVELNETLSNDLTIRRTSSYSSIVNPDSRKNVPNLVYNRAIYSIQNKTSEDLKLTKQDFKGLPKRFRLEEIVIPVLKEVKQKKLSFMTLKPNCFSKDSINSENSITFFYSIENHDLVNSKYGFIKHMSLISKEAKAIVCRVIQESASGNMNIESINRHIEKEVNRENKLWEKYYLENVKIELKRN